jgi:hypothetical protein
MGTTKHQRMWLGGIVKQHNRSCLNLIALLAVATLASSLVLAAVFGGVTMAVAGGEPPRSPDGQPEDSAPGRTFSGVITDARCGSKHMDTQQSASGCARLCVSNGAKYIIVDGDRNYQLAGNLEQVDQLAGQRVIVTGVLNGNTINVKTASLQVENSRR